MPGIFGIISEKESSITTQSFEKMLTCMCHESDYDIQKYSFYGGKCLIGNISVKLPGTPNYYYKDPETENVCTTCKYFMEFEGLFFCRFFDACLSEETFCIPCEFQQ